MALSTITRNLIACFFFAGSLAGASLAQPSQYQLDAVAAQSYADAYTGKDLEAMAALLAEDAVFEDPANRWEGKDAIVEGSRDGFRRLVGQGPDSREIRKFRSGDYFVFAAWADFTMLMAPGELPESDYNFKVDFLMILKVEDGKIVEHKDYVDTEAFGAQLQAQMAAKSAGE